MVVVRGGGGGGGEGLMTVTQLIVRHCPRQCVIHLLPSPLPQHCHGCYPLALASWTIQLYTHARGCPHTCILNVLPPTPPVVLNVYRLVTLAAPRCHLRIFRGLKNYTHAPLARWCPTPGDSSFYHTRGCSLRRLHEGCV
jgi:hypothetical protein